MGRSSSSVVMGCSSSQGREWWGWRSALFDELGTGERLGERVEASGRGIGCVFEIVDVDAAERIVVSGRSRPARAGRRRRAERTAAGHQLDADLTAERAGKGSLDISALA